MSTLMTSVVGDKGSVAALAASEPISNAASLPEARARLHLDHAEVEASLERLRDFLVAGDLEIARGEWDELEGAILRHIDAEDMFLLPEFAREQPDEAAAQRAEHVEIRTALGELGVAFDLHTVRLTEVDALSRIVMRHVAREERTLYPWARTARDGALLDAVLRRLPRAPIPRSPVERTTTTLLALLRVSGDGEQGYRAAAHDLDEPAQRDALVRIAKERAEIAENLRSALVALGISARFEGTVFGAVHRGWIDTGAKVALGKTRRILRACERGDELAVRTYRAALRSDLPAATRAMVQAQLAVIERSLEAVRALAATVA